MEARSRRFGSGEWVVNWQRLPNKMACPVVVGTVFLLSILIVSINVVTKACLLSRGENGLLGCEKGEEKRSRAEVTQLDLRLPSLCFHSNDQAAVEVDSTGARRASALVGEA